MIIPTTDANFGRDPNNNAVINTNTAAYLLYRQQRNGEKGVDALRQEVGELKTELNDIKQLLQQLIQK